MTEDPRLHCAQIYQELGWPVFVLTRYKTPVGNCAVCRPPQHMTPQEKQACPCIFCHGFYAATLNPDVLRYMLTEKPRGLLAVRTGAKPDGSGLVVADFDAPKGGDGPDGLAVLRELRNRNLVPETLAARTGGGGVHLVYAHPGVRIPTIRDFPKPGADVKGDGGYFVVQPSLHPRTGEPYRWVNPGARLVPLPPVWVARLKDPPATAGLMPAVAAMDPAMACRRLDRMLAKLATLRRDENPGGYLAWATRRAGEMVRAGLITEAAAAGACYRAAVRGGLVAAFGADSINGDIARNLARGITGAA